MVSVVQSPGLGNAFRGRCCVARVGNLYYPRVDFAAAHQGAVEVRKKQPMRSLSSQGHHSTTKELLDASLEYHELIEQMTKYRLDQVPFHVNHKEDPSRYTTVPRREFLAASTSLAATEDFLKRKVGVSAQQKVKITYSLAHTPDEVGVYGEECELNEQTLEAHSMPYLVGYANGWFVSEL